MQRDPASHKYDFGHVLVIGGSPGMVGAPFLAARAALRIGGGLVTIASSSDVINKLEKRVEELMTLRLSKDAHELIPFIEERQVSVVVVGPGMQPGFAATVLSKLEEQNMTSVVDGGGLSALQQNPGLIKAGMVLTPHLGEFKRFFNENEEVSKPSKQAAELAKKHQVILVLKGHPTYVCAPDGQVFEDSTGGPELASAGAGDVLSGMVGGIVAQKIQPLEAAKAAVHLHGLAGKLAADAKTEPGTIASDVIESIPAALKLVMGSEL